MEEKKKKASSSSSSSSSSSTLSIFFRKLSRKRSSGGASAWPWKLLKRGSSSGKRRINLHLFVDNLLFKIVSVFEAVFLVSTLCFFYLCCGCHF